MNTVKKLLFMLMLTAGCADLHAPIIYYNIGEKLKRALIVNQADIGTKTWEKFLREEFQDDNLTFHVTVNNCESFKVNQIIREEHFQVFLDSSYTRIMVTRSKQLVAPAPAAAETASADTALAAAAESPKKNDGDSGSSDDQPVDEQPVYKGTPTRPITLDYLQLENWSREQLIFIAANLLVDTFRGKQQQEGVITANEAIEFTVEKYSKTDEEKNETRLEIIKEAISSLEKFLETYRNTLKTGKHETNIGIHQTNTDITSQDRIDFQKQIEQSTKALQLAKNMLLREERRKKVSSIQKICTWVFAVAATVTIAHKAGLASKIGNAVQYIISMITRTAATQKIRA